MYVNIVLFSSTQYKSGFEIPSISTWRKTSGLIQGRLWICTQRSHTNAIIPAIPENSPKFGSRVRILGPGTVADYKLYQVYHVQVKAKGEIIVQHSIGKLAKSGTSCTYPGYRYVVLLRRMLKRKSVSSRAWCSGNNYLVVTFNDICRLVFLTFGRVSSVLNVSTGSVPKKSMAFPFSLTNDPPKRVPRMARCVPTVSIGKSSSVSGFVSCCITYRMNQVCKCI